MGADYQPGRCNIGNAEQDKRRRLGYLGFAASGVFVFAVVALSFPTWTLLLTALPLFSGFMGVLQARERFCAGFAMRGVYDVDGDQVTVEDAGARAADRRRAMLLALQASAYGLAVALGLFLIAGRL